MKYGLGITIYAFLMGAMAGGFTVWAFSEVILADGGLKLTKTCFSMIVPVSIGLCLLAPLLISAIWRRLEPERS